jgi:hypothetical protein
MHAGFEQFKAFDQDAIDDKAFVARGKLTMPVLALGGEKSFGPTMAVVMRSAATNVQARYRFPRKVTRTRFFLPLIRMPADVKATGRPFK